VTPDEAYAKGQTACTLQTPCKKCGGTVGVVYRQHKKPGKPKIRCKKCKNLEPKINAATTAANKAKYRAARRNAVPLGGYTDEQKQQIKDIYRERDRLTQVTGKPHHVDHKVPLHGKDGRTGLHIPENLQILTADENLRKSNNMPSDLSLEHADKLTKSTATGSQHTESVKNIFEHLM